MLLCNTHSASRALLSTIYVLVCDPYLTRGGVRQDKTMGTAGEWEHKHMDNKAKGTYRALCHTSIRPSFSQLFPSVPSAIHIVCVCVAVIQPEEGFGWLNGFHTQHGWQREGVCTHISVMELCNPVQPAMPFSFIHILCVRPTFNQKGGYGWLNGRHTQHGWKRQGV